MIEPRATSDFVGREPDRARLASELACAADGLGRILVVTGEAGIGKTWLVRHVVSREAAVIPTDRVRWARCSDAEAPPPLWPWRQLLGDGFDSGAEATDDPFERLHAVARRVEQGCADGPLALVVDDLQWADSESLRLLDTVAAQIGSLPLIVLATLRDPDARGAPRREIAALFRHKEVRRIALEGFSLTELETFVTSRIQGAETAPEDLSALRRVTGGNPYFVDELVRGRGTEELRGIADLASGTGLARTLGEQLARKVATLDDETRRVLVWAASFGTSFHWERLVRLADAIPGAPAPAADAIDRAISARLVEPDEQPGGFRFVHPLVPSTLLAAVPHLERAALHGRVGTLLAAEGGAAPTDTARLAAHFAAAAHLPEYQASALRYSITAGIDAAREHAYAEAATHYRRALSVLDAPGWEAGAAPIGRPELLVALGHSLGLTAPAAADPVLTRAERLADRLAADDPERAARIQALALVIRCEELPPEGAPACRAAFARGERALARIGPADDVLRARLLAALTPLLRYERDRARVRDLAHEALRVAESTGDATARARALEAIHWASLDDPVDEKRLAVATQVLRSAEAEGDARLVVNARLWRYVDLLELGRVEEAEGELGAIEVAAGALGEPRRRYQALCLRAGLLLHRGRLDAAEQVALEARELAQRLGVPARNAPHSFSLIRIAIERDEADRIAEVSTASLDEATVLGRSGASFVAFATTGRTAAGIDPAAVLASAPDSIARDPDWLATLHNLAWNAFQTGDRTACAALTDALRPHATRFVVYHLGAATASVARVLVALARAQQRYDDAVAMIEIGLEPARRADARCELAHLLVDRAAIRIDQGASPDAPEVAGDLQSALAQARELGWARVERRVGELSPSLLSEAERPDTHRTFPRGTFQRRRGGWRVGLGESLADVEDLRGLQLIALLLARPGEVVLASDLLVDAAGISETSIEKARTRVTAGIRRALDHVAAAQPELARYLRRHLRTGKHCGYLPPPRDRVAWSLDPR